MGSIDLLDATKRAEKEVVGVQVGERKKTKTSSAGVVLIPQPTNDPEDPLVSLGTQRSCQSVVRWRR